MKVKLNQEIPNYKEGVVKNENGKPVIMRDIIVMAINSVGPTKEWGKEDKAMAYGLSVRMMSNDVVDLSIDEMKYILDCIGQVASPLIVGTLTEWFDKK